MASRRQSVEDDGDTAVLGRTFATLTRRLARHGRRVRRLALEADQVAADRGIGLESRDKRQRAVLEEIRGQLGYHGAWALWSATSDELAELADRIMRGQVRSMGDLAVKFEVLAWMLLNDGAVVDSEAVDHVRRFGRELRQLVHMVG